LIAFFSSLNRVRSARTHTSQQRASDDATSASGLGRVKTPWPKLLTARRLRNFSDAAFRAWVLFTRKRPHGGAGYRDAVDLRSEFSVHDRYGSIASFAYDRPIRSTPKPDIRVASLPSAESIASKYHLLDRSPRPFATYVEP
jgi:hypothetical protein